MSAGHSARVDSSGTARLTALRHHRLVPPRRILEPILFALSLILVHTSLHAEREFRVYESLEAQADVQLPPDYQVPGEFVVGRLMYPSNPNFGWFGRGDWHQGGTAWAVEVV